MIFSLIADSHKETLHKAPKSSTPSASQQKANAPPAAVSPIVKKRVTLQGQTGTGKKPTLSVTASSRLQKGGTKTLSPSASALPLSDKKKLASATAPPLKTKTSGADLKPKSTYAATGKATAGPGASLSKPAKTKPEPEKQDHAVSSKKVSPPVKGRNIHISSQHTPPLKARTTPGTKSKATPEIQRKKEALSKQSTKGPVSKSQVDESSKEKPPEAARPITERFDIVRSSPATLTHYFMPLPILKISLSKTVIDSPEILFKKLACNLPNWKMLGRYLELDDQQLATISLLASNPQEGAVQMLNVWRGQSKSLATYTILGEALVNCTKEDLVTIVEEHSRLAVADEPNVFEEPLTVSSDSSLSVKQKEKVSEDEEQSSEADFKMTVPISSLLTIITSLIEERKKEAKVTVSLKFH